MTEPQLYNALHFTSLPSPERHPYRMHTVATLAGLAPVDPNRARVLEIGCGTGVNLVALAASCPESKFVGIDLAADQLDVGRRLAQDLGIANISFEVIDVVEYKPEAESFDYILCHGLYSWVPPQVRTQIPRIFSEGLSAHGLALVSFNATPGWNIRGVIRQMLAIHDQPEASPNERVALARECLAWVKSHQADDPNPYASQLRIELDQLEKQTDALILHELLNPYTRAFLLSEVIEDFKNSGLRSIGDARPSRNLANQTEGETLHELMGDDAETRLKREGFFDLLYPRSLRAMIVCRDSEKPGRIASAQVLEDLWISSSLIQIQEQINIDDDSMAEFADPRQHIIEVKIPGMKLALNRLSELWPTSVRGADLIAGKQRSQVLAELLRFYHLGLVEVSTQPACCTLELGERPRLEELTRRQIALFGWATTWHFEYLAVNEFEKQLVALLDGSRSRTELASAMLGRIVDGALELRVEGKEVSDTEERKKIIEEQLELSLERLVRAGLFKTQQASADSRGIKGFVKNLLGK